MKQSPLVSIITPMYNAKGVVEDAMASVAAQTLGDWEHLLIDDGSTDGTDALAQQYAQVDRRFVLLRNTGRKGALEARNTGLDAARGRYMAFLDADDIWLPAKLEQQVHFMQNSGVGISHTGYRRLYAKSGKLGDIVQPPVELDYWGLLGNTAIVMSAAMVDKAQFANLRVPTGGHPSLRSDLRFWLERMRAGTRAYGVQEDLVRYRVLGGSLSSNPLRSAFWVWRTYRDFEQLDPTTAARAFLSYGVRATKKRLS